MKYLATYSSLLGALCLAVPTTGWSSDRHHHHHHSCAPRPYCGPTVAFRGYYPYPSVYRGYSPYYYAGPSVGLSYSTAPSSSYYRSTRDADSDDSLANDVQRALARRGFYHGAIDGDVGPGTRGAIREYQYRNNLEVTGRIDRALLRSLGLG